jgi:hypothetical protein
LILAVLLANGCGNSETHITSGDGIDAMIQIDAAPVTPFAHPVGIPAGPNNLPASEFNKPYYSGTYCVLTPEDALVVINQAEDEFFDLYINLAGARESFQNPDGTFCLSCFKERLDTFSEVDFSPFALNATIRGHILFDDPHVPENWGGAPVNYEDIDSAASYSRQLFPSMAVGVAAPASFLIGGAPYSKLDFCLTDYNTSMGSFGASIALELASADAADLGIVFNLDVAGLEGGQPMTAYQVLFWGKELVCEPSTLGVLMGTYDSTYFADPAIRSAVRRVVGAASYGIFEDIQCGTAMK